MVYSKPRYIQNAGIFKIRGMFRNLSNINNKMIIMIYFNTGLFFTPGVSYSM